MSLAVRILGAMHVPASHRCQGDNRYIPEPIRRALRYETNFGCPVNGCGVPYVTYHHFDPPYREGTEHNADGMIAMCLAHHKMADAGTWSDEQLRYMKRQPFLTGDRVGGRLEWLRRDVFIQAGSNVALNPGVVLQVGEQKAMWTSRGPDGYLRFNFRIIDQHGAELLHLEDNEWIVTGPMADVRAAASANAIRLVAPLRGVSVNITFRSLSEADCKRLCTKEATSRGGRLPLPADLLASLPPDLIETITPSEQDVVDELWQSIQASHVAWPALSVTVGARMKHPMPLRITRRYLQIAQRLIAGGNWFFMRGATLIAI